jgi:hypothetical protein
MRRPEWMRIAGLAAAAVVAAAAAGCAGGDEPPEPPGVRFEVGEPPVPAAAPDGEVAPAAADGGADSTGTGPTGGSATAATVADSVPLPGLPPTSVDEAEWARLRGLVPGATLWEPTPGNPTTALRHYLLALQAGDSATLTGLLAAHADLPRPESDGDAALTWHARTIGSASGVAAVGRVAAGPMGASVSIQLRRLEPQAVLVPVVQMSAIPGADGPAWRVSSVTAVPAADADAAVAPVAAHFDDTGAQPRATGFPGRLATPPVPSVSMIRDLLTRFLAEPGEVPAPPSSVVLPPPFSRPDRPAPDPLPPGVLVSRIATFRATVAQPLGFVVARSAAGLHRGEPDVHDVWLVVELADGRRRAVTLRWSHSSDTPAGSTGDAGDSWRLIALADLLTLADLDALPLSPMSG